MKKKLLALAIGISVIQVSQAQISKGAWFLGGSLALNFVNSDGTPPNSTTPTQEHKFSSWLVRPQVGKVIAENKILGLFFDVGRNKTEDIISTSKQTRINTTYGGGIFYRQYFPIVKRFFVFGEGDLGFSISDGTSRRNDGTVDRLESEGKTERLRFAIIPGISFAATKKLHLELAMANLLDASYTKTSGTQYNPLGAPTLRSEGNQFSLMSNTNGLIGNIQIGLRWFLSSRNN